MQKFPFRSVNLIALFAMALLTIGVMSSCQPEGCTDPMSDNYDSKAKKDDGSCIPWREKFVGNYPGKNACAGSAEADVSIAVTESGTSDDGIVIAVPSLGLLFTAKVTASTGLTIPSQQITYQSATVTVSGTGSLKNDVDLQLDYTLSNPPLTIPCTLTGKKL
jgi:hypothetical protein